MYFTEFDNIVSRLTSGASDTSESHGHLLGLLCANVGDAVTQWLGALTTAAPTDNALASEARAELYKAGSELAKDLMDGNLDYTLMLPDDDESLSLRTTALAHWCQGFLFGIAQGGVQTLEGLPGDCSEILDDFSELTKASAEDDSEENEAAFVELSEFVRVGSQLIYEELHTAARTTSNVSH